MVQAAMVTPADSDPPEVAARLWDGFAGNLAFEVGANCGQSITLLASRFARVVAFEPYPASCAIAREVPGADVRPVAVSDHDGEVTLILMRDQLLSPGHEAWDRLDAGAMERLTVPCRTLDAIAADDGVPDLVNVDTEGHEEAVLRGAGALLKYGRTAWLIEFHSQDLHQACTGLLEASDYQAETVRHPHYAEGSRLWHQHGWIRALPA